MQFYFCVLRLKRCVGLLSSLFVHTRNIYTLFVYTTAFILGTDKYYFTDHFSGPGRGFSPVYVCLSVCPGNTF